MHQMLIDHLRREHDERVEEYRALEKLLPHGLERAAIRRAVDVLREHDHKHVASVLAAYIERLAEADVSI